MRASADLGKTDLTTPDGRVQLNVRLAADDRRLLMLAALRCRLSLNDFVLAVLRPVIDEAAREDVDSLRRRMGPPAKAEERQGPYGRGGVT